MTRSPVPTPRASRWRTAALLAALALLAACDPRPADRPIKPTTPTVPTPSAAHPPAQR